MGTEFTFDLRPSYLAFKKSVLGFRIFAIGFGAFIGVGALIVFLGRKEIGDEFSVPYVALYVLAAVAVPSLTWVGYSWLGSGPQELLINGQTILFRAKSGQEWSLQWTNPRFRLVLSDSRVNHTPGRPPDAFLIGARIPAQGFSTLLSPEAFEALLAASRSIGLSVQDEVLGLSTQWTQRQITITRP